MQRSLAGSVKPKPGLRLNDLQAWMWEQHQKLEQCIAAKLENVIVEECIKGECHVPQIFSHKDPDCPVPAHEAVATRRIPLVTEEIVLGPFLTFLSPGLFAEDQDTTRTTLY